MYAFMYLVDIIVLGVEDLLGEVGHEIFYDQAVLFLFYLQHVVLGFYRIAEVLEGVLVVHVFAAVEGALVVAALGQAQVLGVEALEFGRDLRGLLLVLLLLLSHIVEPLHEDGLVE